MSVREIRLFTEDRGFGIGLRAGLAGIAALLSLLLLLYLSTYTPRAAGRKAAVEVIDPDNVLSGAIVALAPFTVNLGEPDSFLRVGLEIELFDFEPPADLDQHLPRVRDAVVSLLAAKSPSELLTASGKEDLKTELLEAVNGALPVDNQAVRIYLTEFTVQ